MRVRFRVYPLVRASVVSGIIVTGIVVSGTDARARQSWTR